MPKDTAAPVDPDPVEPTPERAPEPEHSAPDPTVPVEPAPAEHRFFSWIRSLGLARGDGWIGGVAVGVADRTGLDPVLVRGIIVVVAVLGGPVVLLYALAWLVLPDPDGRIHLQQLGHGRVTRAHAGIAGLLLLSMLPLTQGFWFAGATYWGEPDFGASAGRIAWTAIVVVLAALVVVWVARRSGTADPAAPRPAAAMPADPPTVADDAAASAASADLLAEPVPPAAPVDPSTEELDAWKENQAIWQQQRAQWAAAEHERHRRELAEAAAAAVERRRIRQRTRPRASAAVVGVVIGVALLTGGIAALIASDDAAGRGHEWGVGIAAATIAIGLGAAVVGLARRRSGFLAFLGIVGLLATGVGAIVPQDRTLLPPTGYGISSYESGRFAQIGGQTQIYANGDGPDVAPVIDVWSLGSSLSLYLEGDATVQLELVAAPGHGYVQVQNRDGAFLLGGELTETRINSKGESIYRALIGPGETPTLIVRAWLGLDGYLSVQAYVDDDAAADAFTVTPELTDVFVGDEAAQPDPSSTLSPSPTTTPTPSGAP